MKLSHRVLALSLGSASAIIFIGFALWIGLLYFDLRERLSKDWFSPPVEFYYPALKIDSHAFKSSLDAKAHLQGLKYRERPYPEPLHDRDFSSIPQDVCAKELGAYGVVLSQECLRLKDSNGDLYTLAWNESEWIEIFKGSQLLRAPSAFLEPKLIGEVRQGLPVKTRATPLAEIPLLCLHAVTAIEDNQFLQHGGVSPSGIFRAVVRNVLAGKFAQGGSTITQQLVKNYFLSHEKTLRRKLNEQILAILLETQLNKDQILEKYLNVIYMGQEGPFQIIGLGAAAQHYFGKPVSELELGECAMLAAVINSPGRFSPYKQKENAHQRRNLVLSKMQEMNFISEEQKLKAADQPLPKERVQAQDPSAPYFLEATYAELLELGLDETTGFRVLTSLNPKIQLASEEAIRLSLPDVAKKAKKGASPLEAATISVDIRSGQVVALVGGHNYRLSPFNRAISGRRQIGSIVKPFIYLQAFRIHKPWEMILDEPFSWKYDGQDWKPRNYDKKFRGEIPLYEALVQSLNIPAVKLAKEVGLDAIRDTLYASGYTQNVSLLPSLALGTVEMTPMEVAQSYLTLASLGSYKKLSSLLSVRSLSGELLFDNSTSDFEEKIDPLQTAALVSVLKLSPRIGTAQSLKYFGASSYVAGKTGTTNDLKDSWFVGFDPNILTVVWVGYDNNDTTGLTGASGALPVWGQIYRQRVLKEPASTGDFPWPPEASHKTINGFELINPTE